MNKKILVIGSGGREHAIARKLCGEAHVFITPGNAGTADCGTNVDLLIDSESGKANVLDFAKQEGIDLVVVGPEKYLELGFVDYLEDAGIKCFGTRKNASLLESSKIFAKEFMVRHGIPTAKYRLCASEEEVYDACRDFSYPLVLKADGLAAGKGVIICENEKDVYVAAPKLLEISGKIVLEEFISGTEASILCLVDGKVVRALQPARDHKRLLDEDKGPNTGGMGAVCGREVLPAAVAENFETEVAARFLSGISEEGIDFRGVLFVGIMYKPDGSLYVLEFNTRFGDPETEVVLPCIDTPLLELLEATADGRLEQTALKISDKSFAVVVVAAAEYPYSKTKPVEISIAHDSDASSPRTSFTAIASPNILHCGTSRDAAGRLVATGGRVLACLGSGDSLQEAVDAAYREVKKVDFAGMQYRSDIGVLR